MTKARLLYFVPTLLVAVLFHAAVRTGSAGEIDRGEKKIIKLYGKDRPDPAFVRENIQAIRDSGLDGICLNVLPDDGIPLELWGDNGNYLWFGAVELQRSRFARVIADLKATEFGNLTDNFVHSAVRGPAIVDWFDDEWEVVLNNAQTLGWVVKQGGLKGITFDVEDGSPFFYTEERRTKHSFEDYVARVRECGRQWISALCQENPDITLILVYGYWITAHRMERSGIDDMQYADYALFPAFLDGILEGAPPTATIVDGHEDTYPYTCRKTFASFLSRCRDESLLLTSVPDLYRSRMKRALAVWMDYPHYNVMPNSTLNSPSGDHRTAEEFEHALHNALLLTDRYVWIYNYTNAWWPISLPTYKDKGITQVPEAYRAAVERSREPHDPDWAPLPPDITSYAADQLPPADLLGDEYESLETLSNDWWFTTVPDVRRAENFDRFEAWAEQFTVGLKEAASLWTRIDVRRPWELQGWPYDGGAWYRVRFSASAQTAGRQVWLWIPRVFGDVKAYAACEGRGPAAEARAIRVGSGVLIPLTGQVRPERQTLVAVRVFNAEGPGGLAGSPVLVGRKGERTLAFEGNELLVDLDLSQADEGKVPNKGVLGGRASIRDAKAVPEGAEFDGSRGYASLENGGLSCAIDGAVTWECTFSFAEAMEDPVRFRILMARHPSYMNGLYLDYAKRPNHLVFIQGTGSDMLDYPVEPGKAYHAVATYDGNEMRLYVNGKLVGERTTPVSPPAIDAPLLIGGGTSDVPRHASCIVRDARLYNWALSPAEIAQRAAGVTQHGD